MTSATKMWRWGHDDRIADLLGYCRFSAAVSHVTTKTNEFKEGTSSQIFVTKFPVQTSYSVILCAVQLFHPMLTRVTTADELYPRQSEYPYFFYVSLNLCIEEFFFLSLCQPRTSRKLQQ
jgi:hypothetical protein